MKQFINFTMFIFCLNFSLIQAQEHKIQSSESCKDCHQDIYQQWVKSRHANATPSKNILFAKLYQKSQQDTEGQTKLYCIRCHAPVSMVNGDVDLKQEITNEGVTCDICHTTKELTKDPQHWPLILSGEDTKFGPSKKLPPHDHESAYSNMFEGGKLCSGCHGGMIDVPQMQGCSDLTICDTSGEWEQSSFSKNKSGCNECHATHSFEGAYSEEILQQAVDLNIEVNEFGGKINLNVTITNSGTGHLLPTGPPARLIFIKVLAYDQAGKVIWSNFNTNPMKEDPYGVFHVVFANSLGQVPALPWIAAKIVKDTRLKPEESRKLIYKFPAENVEKIEAKLFYRLAPSPLLDKFEITDEYLKKSYLMAEVTKKLN